MITIYIITIIFVCMPAKMNFNYNMHFVFLCRCVENQWYILLEIRNTNFYRKNNLSKPLFDMIKKIVKLDEKSWFYLFHLQDFPSLKFFQLLYSILLSSMSISHSCFSIMSSKCSSLGWKPWKEICVKCY